MRETKDSIELAQLSRLAMEGGELSPFVTGQLQDMLVLRNASKGSGVIPP